ncbi:Retrovirus-related Pol polyprotein from transposon TNT 1-94 [Vitis vinifera]|uniref:Retrovirus-related Pol polyprotein from transposon TNT 1-94 n=1 Tax=Vitis vinifera TaxID=29760 RepID=A0A438BY25_VITVI|nr:Retrovirus-related Pol polyprotein from transposon TNT 1-94 [Vitis vinifera]
MKMILLMCNRRGTDALLLAVDSPLDDWVLDSGASFHTTPHREIIQNYVAGDFGKVYLADGSALDVVGLGDVRICCQWDMQYYLLVVLGRLQRELGYWLWKEDWYSYMTSCPRDTIAVADASTDTSLWHRRLGHMRQKAEKLELVHTDLWGPSPVASLGGSRYYITFIDDSSKRNRFESKMFEDGEDHSWDTTQNGVAERMNRTLNERARSMRLHAGLPKTFWADAVSTAAYLINRGPSVPMEFRLPEEVWSGKETWELTELPVEKKALHNKWVYRIKNEHDGSKHYKARLVVKGFQQKEGIDYTEIFSPIVKMLTIRLVLGMVAAENLHLEQLDMKTAFLHGDLEEDLYMIQPEGFIVQGQENLGLALRRLIIEEAIVQTVCNEGFGSCKANPWFNMNEAKPVSTPLGSHFKLSKEQSPKTEEERDHMSKVPYASAIGSLMYAMVCTRIDIAHAVGVVSSILTIQHGSPH